MLRHLCVQQSTGKFISGAQLEECGQLGGSLILEDSLQIGVITELEPPIVVTEVEVQLLDGRMMLVDRQI